MLFLLSYRPLTTHCIDPRHTPRQRRAHRTGEASATNPCRCGCSADVPCIDASGRRTRRHQSVVRMHPRAARAEASRHSASALHDVPCLETSMFRMLRDRAMQSRCDRVLAFANAKKKTPPGCGPEGVRVPREVGVTDLPCAGDQSQWPCSSRARRPKPLGLRASCWAMGKKMFMALRR